MKNPADICIISSSGQEVKKITITDEEIYTLNVSDLNKGLYFIKRVGDNTVQIKPFIKL
ncbi:MAG: T9SS type A sorting domain-containing protein [Sphingobacteriales bacterium]|nr:T9SS type A sorting domain-containing protein [Sphingobacteriales bacterium]